MKFLINVYTSTDLVRGMRTCCNYSVFCMTSKTKRSMVESSFLNLSIISNLQALVTERLAIHRPNITANIHKNKHIYIYMDGHLKMPLLWFMTLDQRQRTTRTTTNQRRGKRKGWLERHKWWQFTHTRTNTLGLQSDWGWKDCCRRKWVLFSGGSERQRGRKIERN